MNKLSLITISNDGRGASMFGERSIQLIGEPVRMLSEQQNAENFRFRTSEAGYQSDWHTAGDSTLLIIVSGKVKIELRDQSSKTFASGSMFIAEDYLRPEIIENSLHGHRARVIGEQPLLAIHIKLNRR